MGFWVWLVLGLALLSLPSSGIAVLPAVDYVGAVSEASCGGGSCRGLWNPVSIGAACINVEVWGIRGGLEQAASGYARMVVEEGGVLRTVSRWRLNAVPNSHILGFHEVVYGAKPWGNPQCEDLSFLDLPARLRSLPRLVVAANYTVLRAQPGINMALDAWLFVDSDSSRAPRAGDVEIMVELRADFREDYAKIGSITAPVFVDGRLMYVAFDVILYEFDWTFIKFKTTQNLEGFVVFDFMYFVEKAKEVLRARGWSRGGTTPDGIEDLYLMSLEFGSEVYTGTRAPVDIDVEWLMYDYHIIKAPRDVSTEQALRDVYNILTATVAGVFSQMRNVPNSVGVLVGRSNPRGPVKNALVEDNLASAVVASVVGTRSVFFDDEVLSPADLSYRPKAWGLRYLVAVGGPLVNLAAWRYNLTAMRLVKTYATSMFVGFEVKGLGDVRRAYLSLIDYMYYVEYRNGTVKRIGQYGSVDFAMAAVVYDWQTSMWVVLLYGLDWRGTVAVGRWLGAEADALNRTAMRQILLFRWKDADGDGFPTADEVEVIWSK